MAEYNPFHNGHLYHIEQTKKMGATHTVAVMSGNFVQRSEPAIVSKFDRARAAVSSGVDLVIELPLAYATAVSERFAFGAVSALDALGVVEMLSFGSECGDIKQLLLASEAIFDARVLRRIKQLTEMGESYPAAQAKALEVFYPSVSRVVGAPNNILGVDYLKALKKLSGDIIPVTVERKGAGHDSDEISRSIAGAKNIRELVRRRGTYEGLMPKESELMLLDATVTGRLSMGMQRVESAVLYKLRQMTKDEMNLLPDAATGIGDRLFHASRTASTVEELYDMTKTKRYTMSRVRRAVITAFLGIDETDYISIPYIRLLAIGAKGGDILREMKRRCRLPVSGSLSEITEYGGVAAKTAVKESVSTDIYNLTLEKRAAGGEDFTARLFRY